ncbi:hypothetical protein, partial [Pseudomonas indica]|uniref:hypothetical protein n=1 Tax=Pseudomonas indica TaxID=137658 RepID=UPI0023F66598
MLKIELHESKSARSLRLLEPLPILMVTVEMSLDHSAPGSLRTMRWSAYPGHNRWPFQPERCEAPFRSPVSKAFSELY